jgi:hypothetical protein
MLEVVEKTLGGWLAIGSKKRTAGVNKTHPFGLPRLNEGLHCPVGLPLAIDLIPTSYARGNRQKHDLDVR